MMEFLVKRIVPPGGNYPYLVPETGVLIVSHSIAEAVERVSAHLRSNNLSVPPNLGALIEDYICRNVPPGFCFGDADGKPVARAVTLEGIKKATIALVTSTGRADPGVARKRIDICGGCEHNDRRMCPSCIGLISWARRLVGTQCPRDEWLGVCSVDVTALAAKIHVDKVDGANKNYPDKCWVKEAH